MNRWSRTPLAWLVERVGAMSERWQDAALAVLFCALDLLGFSDIVTSSASEFPVTLVAYAAAGYVILAWRRRIPVTVFVVMWVHSMVAAIAVPHSYRPMIGLMVALYTVATLDRRGPGLVALALVFVPAGFGVAAEVGDSTPRQALATLVAAALFQSLISGGAWSMGRWEHSHRKQVGLLEQQQEMVARAAVAGERSRVARDLHDIIAHSVSVMLLQAAGARRVLAADPDRAASALANIEGAGTQATVELRRLLNLLREGDQADDDQLRPQQGLDELKPLLEGVRAAGVPVRLFVHGTPGKLDPSVDLAAYRIVQESLTNVTKHAGPGTNTTIALWWQDDLDLDITNDGPAHLHREPLRSPCSGYGLLGLRERAAAVGGRLEAGPLGGNGFRVSATLPRADRPAVTHHAVTHHGPADLSHNGTDLGKVFDLGQLGVDEVCTKPVRRLRT